ncbi:MAG: hypothetical protein BECKG1743E_GA0114224_110911, partial [Candidatus Kentron sp. G]
DVKCLGFLYLYVGRYPRNNASRNRRNNRRIVHYVTVIATQKLDDKDKQVGIFFDRNRLKPSEESLHYHGPRLQICW